MTNNRNSRKTPWRTVTKDDKGVSKIFPTMKPLEGEKRAAQPEKAETSAGAQVSAEAEAAQLQGGVGTAGSANVGDRYAMFEAVHGSAPRLIEAGLGEYASPESILRAGALMLSHIGRADAAHRLTRALDACPLRPSGEAAGPTARAFGDWICAHI